MAMVFHEQYGELRDSTLRLIKKANVSPADYEALLDKFGRILPHWDEIEAFIKKNIPKGSRSYRAPLYY